jgi:RNA polymerase sigma-70 factor (ECF subfamily)
MRSDDESGDPISDAELIQRWKSGDERAATQLVGRYAASIGRYAASLGVRADLQEIVQDTFVRAFGSLDDFRGESTLRTWLFTIARRLVLDARRAHSRRREVDEIREDHTATGYDALDNLVAEEAHMKMREALTTLSPTQREVFTLRVNDGLSYRDIAAVVGTTEGAARVHFHNALRQVKERLHA